MMLILTETVILVSHVALDLQGLSGQAFCGPDVGGFAGDATPKLFARWMGLGAMLPFARGHSEQGTIDQEPWSFGPEVILLLFLYWAWSGFF